MLASKCLRCFEPLAEAFYHPGREKPALV